MLLQRLKPLEIMVRNTFCPDKHLCFLARKSHSTLLRDSGYPICYDFPLFATIRDCLPLFGILETTHTIHSIRYLLFGTVRYSQLFAICYSGFPCQTPVYMLDREAHLPGGALSTCPSTQPGEVAF